MVVSLHGTASFLKQRGCTTQTFNGPQAYLEPGAWSAHEVLQSPLADFGESAETVCHTICGAFFLHAVRPELCSQAVQHRQASTFCFLPLTFVLVHLF